ncbi:40847_t:CDS:2, partial [Gigaspora margarita]
MTLKRIKAKMVFISFIYFKSHEDLNSATENVAWYYNIRLIWDGSNQKNILIAMQRQEITKENFSHMESFRKESYKPYKKNFSDIAPRNALTVLKTDQNTLNQPKILDKILRRLQNIEKRSK